MYAASGVGRGVSLPSHIESESLPSFVEIELKFTESCDGKAVSDAFELVDGVVVFGH